MPGAINIVTCCSNLRARMRLTDETLDRQLLELAATTRYEFERLDDWLSTNGFRVRRNTGPIGVFLLQRLM